MRRLRSVVLPFCTVLIAVLLFSCATAVPPELPDQEVGPVHEETVQEQAAPARLTVVFGGDVMAHTENTSMDDYSQIWQAVARDIQDGDLAFANLETPVSDTLPYRSYPAFNIHSEYADAAVQAGFNVLSLCNNHTNDQKLAGIRSTQSWADSRPVQAAGLREKGQPLSYRYFEKNGWRILFLPITEILNSTVAADYINYVPADGRSREEFISYAAQLRRTHPADLFVIGVHTHEPEYVRTISEPQRAFYLELIDCAGADVIWANHPHVVKPWEILSRDGTARKLIMYANGNTVSGQRRDPRFDAPETARDYTGDGCLIRAVFTKPSDPADNTGIILDSVACTFITTYIDPSGHFILRRLDDACIQELRSSGRNVWADYLEARKTIMERIKGTTTCR